MPTNNYPGVGYKYGKDYNFFEKFSITTSSFGGDTVDGYQPDTVIPFSTQGVLFLNESTSDIVEVSFNGRTVHLELDPTTISKAISFDNRVISTIWFRVKSGSSGPITVSVQAWAIR